MGEILSAGSTGHHSDSKIFQTTARVDVECVIQELDIAKYIVCFKTLILNQSNTIYKNKIYSMFNILAVIYVKSQNTHLLSSYGI